MTEWLHRTLLGVEGWQYLALLGVVFGALIAGRICEVVLRRYLRRMVARAGVGGLDSALDRADRALGFLTVALVIDLAIPVLTLPPVTEGAIRLGARTMVAIGGVWLVFRMLDVGFGYLASKAARTESKLDDQLVPIARRTAKIFTALVGGLFALQNLDVDVGSLLAGLGLGGLAFALAAKDTVANFFGSLVIFIDKPFTIGDRIKLDGHEGVVEEVGFRSTRVRTFQDSLLTVPNGLMTTAIVDNWGARRYRRYLTKLGVTYDTPAEKVQAFCTGVRAVLAGMPDVRKDFYLVEFTGFADYALEVFVYCFLTAATWPEELRARGRINLELLRLAEHLSVRFAFPTSTLHVESLPAAAPPTREPTAPAELSAMLHRFGPAGDLARPTGIPLPTDFDPAAPAAGGPLLGLDEGDAP